MQSEVVQMDIAYILCVFALSFLVTGDFVVLNCEAVAPLCSRRAVMVPATEVEAGFKCVCRRDFFGENCRFKGTVCTLT